MPPSIVIRRCRVTRRAMPAVVLAAVALAASGAGADIIKKEDMRRGITTTHARCAATAQTVWVTADGRDFCVRYYVSTAGGEGVRPVVFLSGDYFGSVNLRTWQWIATAQDRNASVAFDPTDQDIDTDDLVTTADGFSRMAKTTAIHLARIGVAGTSGHHVFRKTLLELHLMNAALDAIKQSHGFEGFHLVGQSGGSIVVTGLAGLRRDIGCAVMGSGRLATRHDTGSKDPARTLIDPPRFIPSIAQNRALRFMVVTDPADLNVPLRQQTAFVEEMRRAGRDIPQYFVAAIDEYHHGVVEYAQLVTAGCALGRSDAEIATAVATMVRRDGAYNELRRREMALFGKTGSSPQRPAVAPRVVPASGLAPR
jgi:pimeloyl-ACP methyl ester carboxylesterase